MMKELKELISEIDRNRERWTELVNFLVSKRDEARKNNIDSDGYERTLDKIVELISK